MLPRILKLIGLGAVVVSANKTPADQKALTPGETPVSEGQEALITSDQSPLAPSTGVINLPIAQAIEHIILIAPKISTNISTNSAITIDANHAQAKKDVQTMFDSAKISYDDFIEFLRNGNANIGDFPLPDKFIETALDKSIACDSSHLQILLRRGFSPNSEFDSSRFGPISVLRYALISEETTQCLVDMGLNIFYVPSRAGGVLQFNPVFVMVLKDNAQLKGGKVILAAQKKVAEHKKFARCDYPLTKPNARSLQTIISLDPEGFQNQLPNIDKNNLEKTLDYLCKARAPGIFIDIIKQHPDFLTAVKKQDSEGKTPIYIAVENKANWLVERLAFNSSIVLDQPAKDGTTALVRALEVRNYKGMKILLENGADPTAAVALALKKSDQKALSLLRSEYDTQKSFASLVRELAWLTNIQHTLYSLIVILLSFGYYLRKIDNIADKVKNELREHFLLNATVTGWHPSKLQIVISVPTDAFVARYRFHSVEKIPDQLKAYQKRILNTDLIVKFKIPPDRFRQLFKKYFIAEIRKINGMTDKKASDLMDNLAKKGDSYIEFPISIYSDPQFSLLNIANNIYYNLIADEFKNRDKEALNIAKAFIDKFFNIAGIRLTCELNETGDLVFNFPSSKMISFNQNDKQYRVERSEFIDRFKRIFEQYLNIISSYTETGFVIPKALARVLVDDPSITNMATRIKNEILEIATQVEQKPLTMQTEKEKFPVPHVKSAAKKPHPIAQTKTPEEKQIDALFDEIKNAAEAAAREDDEATRKARIIAHNLARQAEIDADKRKKNEREKERQKKIQQQTEQKQAEVLSEQGRAQWLQDVAIQTSEIERISSSILSSEIPAEELQSKKFKAALALQCHLLKLINGLIQSGTGHSAELAGFRTVLVHMLNQFDVEEIFSGITQTVQAINQMTELTTTPLFEVAEFYYNSLITSNLFTTANSGDEKATDDKETNYFLIWIKEKIIPIMNFLWLKPNQADNTSNEQTYQFPDSLDLHACMTMLSMIGELYPDDRRQKINQQETDNHLKDFLLRCRIVRNVIAHWGSDWQGYEITTKKNMTTAVFTYDDASQNYICTLQTGRFKKDQDIKKFDGKPKEITLEDYIKETCALAVKVTQQKWDKPDIDTSYELTQTSGTLPATAVFAPIFVPAAAKTVRTPSSTTSATDTPIPSSTDTSTTSSIEEDVIPPSTASKLKP